MRRWGATDVWRFALWISAHKPTEQAGLQDQGRKQVNQKQSLTDSKTSVEPHKLPEHSWWMKIMGQRQWKRPFAQGQDFYLINLGSLKHSKKKVF